MTTLTNWKLDPIEIERTQHDLQKLIDIADLINQAQGRYSENIRYAQSQVCQDFFPELRPKAIRQAQISKAAAVRLRQTFANLLNEISL